MEPFGLFQLLNSLLPKSTEGTEENAESVQKKEEKSEPTTSPVPTPNVCLSFFEAHDRRAKNTRR